MKTICVHMSNYHGPQDMVYIGRPSDWGNPFKIGHDGTRKECIDKYRQWIRGQDLLMERLPELKGKALACWCKPYACHGDVLVELIEGDTWKLFF